MAKRLNIVIPEAAFPEDPGERLFEAQKRRIPPEAFDLRTCETVICTTHDQLVEILAELLELLEEVEAIRIESRHETRNPHAKHPTVYEGVFPDRALVASALFDNQDIICRDPSITLLFTNEERGAVQLDQHKLIRVQGNLSVEHITQRHVIPFEPRVRMVDEIPHTHAPDQPSFRDKLSKLLHSLSIDGGNWDQD